jgi:hypothetical protein
MGFTLISAGGVGIEGRIPGGVDYYVMPINIPNIEYKSQNAF